VFNTPAYGIKKSCQQQFAIEQADNSSFDAYLEHYFIDA
jgi:hypothetical protein